MNRFISASKHFAIASVISLSFALPPRSYVTYLPSEMNFLVAAKIAFDGIHIRKTDDFMIEDASVFPTQAEALAP